MADNEKELLSLPRRKAFNDDTACVSGAHISLRSTELERTLETEIDILVKKYPSDAGSMNISSNMFNYISLLVIDAHLTIM